MVKILPKQGIAVLRHQQALEGPPLPPLNIAPHQSRDNGQRQLLGDILEIIHDPKGVGVHDETFTPHLEQFPKLLAIFNQGMDPKGIGKGFNDQFFELTGINIFHTLGS